MIAQSIATGPSCAEFSTSSKEIIIDHRDLGNPGVPFLQGYILVLSVLCRENTFRTPRSVVLPSETVPSSQEGKADAKPRFKDATGNT